MKKLVFLAVGAILFLGAIAVGAVLLLTGGDAGGPAPAFQAPATTSGLAPAGAPPGVAGVTGPTGYPSGPKRIHLSPGRVRIALTEPLAHCFQSYPMGSTLPAVLTLDLEAQSNGGFAVVDVTVKSWGGATRALVDCAADVLRGQIVAAGAFTSGDRALYDYLLEAPAVADAPPPESLPSSLPASRQQLPQRRGGSGR